MEDSTKLECIFCGQEVSISLRTIRDKPKDKSAILKLWNNECAKTMCEILLGRENISVFLQYFQDYNFCANCDQIVRDIQYFIYQVEAFKKRIHTLTQLVRSRLLVRSRDIISNNTETMKQTKTLETRISTLIAEGPNGLKSYTHQQISEIMCKMASDKCSNDHAEADKSHFIHTNTEMFDEKSKLLESEYNYVEMELEIKTEPEENMIDDYNNIDDNDYTNEAMSDHNNYFNEEEINPLEEGGLSDTKYLLRSSTKKDRKVKRLQRDWKNDDTSNGSADNQDSISGAEDTFSDESLKLNVHSTNPSNKRSRKTEKKRPTLEERAHRFRQSQLRNNKRRREKTLAARLAKISEDPVQKVVLKLNPEPTEEERLEIQKMIYEERRRLSQLRFNKKRRDMRLAEKIVKGCVCGAEGCGLIFPSKSEADDHYRKFYKDIKTTEIKKEDNTYIGSEANGDTNIGSDDNGDKLSGTEDTLLEESVLKLIDRSRKQNLKMRLKCKQRSKLNEQERQHRFRQSQLRQNKQRREKLLAARLAKIGEDPVQKIVLKLNPEPTDEERLAIQKMTPQERRRLSQLRTNKKRRDMRLAEKMVKGIACPAENCRKAFTRKDEAEGHYREIHEGCTVDAYHCENCPEKFSEYKLLHAHNKERDVCGKCIGKVECTFCGKRYITEAELNVHLSEAHTGPNPFNCGFCEMEYTNSVELRKHTEELHLDVAKNICEECGKIYPFNKIGAFRSHLKSHRIAKAGAVHNCEQCSKTFPSVGLLNHHVKVHDKDETFICEICSKECVGKNSLRCHKKRCHDKRYKCNICDKAYHRLPVLRDHEISHTGIRNFVCQLCGKAFLTQGYWRSHQLHCQGKRIPSKKKKSKKKISNVKKPKLNT